MAKEKDSKASEKSDLKVDNTIKPATSNKTKAEDKKEVQASEETMKTNKMGKNIKAIPDQEQPLEIISPKKLEDTGSKTAPANIELKEIEKSITDKKIALDTSKKPDTNKKAPKEEKVVAKPVAKVIASNEKTSEETLKKPQYTQKQNFLNRVTRMLEKSLSKPVQDSYINKLAKGLPTIEVANEDYFETAKFLKETSAFEFNYLSSLHGSDFETHMEVFIHLYSFKNNQTIVLKTKLDRENPEVDSVTSLWKGASWSESETYDLLGIFFKNNKALHRIFLGEHWVGHPLRKDYQQYDGEVSE